MKKPSYYIYYSYKDNEYHIFDRLNFVDTSFISFKKLYNFINKHNIPYDSCRLKSMTLKEFFEYACFGGDL